MPDQTRRRHRTIMRAAAWLAALAFAPPAIVAQAIVAQAIVAQAWAAQPSAARGRLIFLRCASCHAVAEGAAARIGPNLRGVVGRPAGSLPGYDYSPAMRQAKLVWDPPTLDRWLTKPTSLVPGTAMGFAGLADAQDRAAVIAYLQTLSK